MLPDFNQSGLLPEGVHWSSWDEIRGRFGQTPRRQQLLGGLRIALEHLKVAGCHTVYLNGSFVTDKRDPGDFDACWEEAGVDPDLLDPVLLTFDEGRAAQKAKYGGELFPATSLADGEGTSFVEFFQIDRETGARKGIVAIDLGGMR